MAERRTADRRKRAADFRINVKRREFEQLRGAVVALAERVAALQKQVDDLRRKMRS